MSQLKPGHSDAEKCSTGKGRGKKKNGAEIRSLKWRMRTYACACRFTQRVPLALLSSASIFFKCSWNNHFLPYRPKFIIRITQLIIRCFSQCFRPSQWPGGLRHKLSSLTRTLGSWVRIQLQAWMSVCVYSVFVLFCVQVAALRRAKPPSKEPYQLCIGLRN
jgi:hypothetical protein